jgi:hypothetical protein
LVKCEVGAEEDNEDFERLGDYLQGEEERRDEDIAYRSGIADSRAAKDRKHLKLMMKTMPEHFWRSGMMAK